MLNCKIKLSKKIDCGFWPQIILFILICEKLYNHTYISGLYNIPVTLAFFISSICFLLIGKIKIKKSDAISLVIIVLVVIYGFCKETVRYGFVLFSLLMWSKLKIKNIDIFQRMLVIIAAIFSITDLSNGYNRISGYNAGSPTLFSCAIVVNFIYFLFKTEKKYSDYLFAILCFFLVLGTKSSSTLIFMIALIAYKVIINLFYNLGFNYKLMKKYIFILIIIVSIILFFNLDIALGIIGRENRNASTLTRFDIYKKFLTIWMSSIKTFFLGYSGGYTQKYIKQFWGISSHLPLHQDVLMLFCEYGIIGFVLIYNYIIKKLRLNFLMILALVLASFHNIILSPATLILLVFTSNSLNKQYEKTQTLWR